MRAAGGNAGRMNLREAGVGEVGPPLVAPPGGRDVAALGVGREVKDVAVAARAQHDGVAGELFVLPGDEVAGDDAAGDAVDQHEVEHLAAGNLLDLAGRNLPHHGAVRAEQQLLPRLAAGVKRPRDLRPAERAVGQRSAVLAGEGHAQGGAVVDDQVADLGQPIDVGLAAAEVAPLHRVVKQPPDAVAVVRVVLGGVDSPLGRDAVGPARRILQAEGEDVVAQLGERRRRPKRRPAPCRPR